MFCPLGYTYTMNSRIRRFLSNSNVLDPDDRRKSELRMQRVRLLIFAGLFLYELVFWYRRLPLPDPYTTQRIIYALGMLIYLPIMPIICYLRHRKNREFPGSLFHPFLSIDIILIASLGLLLPAEIPRLIILYLFIPPFLLLPSLLLRSSLSITAGITGGLSFGLVLSYLSRSEQLPREPQWIFLFVFSCAILALQGLIIASLIDSNRMRYLRVLGYQNMLRRQRDRLEKTKTSQQEFFAGMSHELRTPLNGILGMAGLIIESKPTQDQHEYAQGIQNNAEALLTLINNILDLSKIEAGKLIPESRSFDLKKTIDLVLQTVSHSASGADIQVSARIHPRVPRFITGDQGRLMQILFNLMGNGVKFTHRGQVALEIHREPVSADFPEPTLSFRISDTGPGIPPEQLSQIFEKYSQFYGDSHARQQRSTPSGTGLGLAITKELVQLLGGSITVSSTPGTGSVFTVYLPLGEQTASLQHLAGSNQTELFDLESQSILRVLIVDDNPGNRRILERMVTRYGATPYVAASGREAVDIFKQQPIDLAIIDYQMPGYSGVETAQEIRTLETLLKRSPALLYLLSGHDPSQFNTKDDPGLSAIQGVLQKPIRIEGVRQLLAEARHYRRNET